jgi:hypothetical protein
MSFPPSIHMSIVTLTRPTTILLELSLSLSGAVNRSIKSGRDGSEIDRRWAPDTFRIHFHSHWGQLGRLVEESRRFGTIAMIWLEDAYDLQGRLRCCRPTHPPLPKFVSVVVFRESNKGTV